MVVLRRTRKLQAALEISAESSLYSETALGDWYVNRLSVDRQPLLILVSARGLLPILIPARDVRTLPARLPQVVGARLKRLGIAAPVIDAEVRAMTPVVVAPTADRSVLGVMVDFAKAAPFYMERWGWDLSTLPLVEARLAETPCFASGPSDQVVFPEVAVPQLLAARWGAG
jgi:hypothetical protein